MVDGYTSKVSQQTKIREVLQQAALLGLERTGFFSHAAFYGGTALRILYGLDRFSEDLDFTLLKPDEGFQFKPFLEGLSKELSSLGFHMDVTQKNKTVETSVLSAFLKVNTIQLLLAIGEDAKKKNHNEKIQIKLEIDTLPTEGFRLQNRLVLNPVPFYVITLDQRDLFAGKMHALLYRAWKGRVKGRDWYDLYWYIQNQIPLSITYLAACMRQAGQIDASATLDRKQVIDRVQAKTQAINWEDAKNDMRPFIADPEKLAIWSPQFFSDLIEHLLVE